jgi:hypothetical protein
MDMLRSDLRVACRQMLKAPAFAATVILVLAAGFGVSNSIYSVVRDVLLTPLPHKEPWRPVQIVSRWPAGHQAAPGMVERIAVARMQCPPERGSIGIAH